MSSFSQLHRRGSVLARCAVVAVALLAGTGCFWDDDPHGDGDMSQGDDDDGGDGDDGDGDGDYVNDGWGVYERGSLPPLFDLPSLDDLNSVVVAGEALTAADFVAKVGGYVPVAQKLFEIESQIAAETGLEVDLVGPDESLAEGMPFRGNPSDLELLRLDGRRIAVVPLGGSVGIPGNQVAAVDLERGVVEHIQVGVRPVRAAAHPAGLVFVCHQYSNYISVIDARNLRLLFDPDGTPVELTTDFSCSDILVAPRVPGEQPGDDFDLHVVNPRLARIERHRLEIVRDARTGTPVNVVPQPDGESVHVIGGVGRYPQRLRLSHDRTSLTVASGRGGEVARIVLPDTVVGPIEVGGPALDVLELDESSYVLTTTRDRGLLSRDQPVPDAVNAAPVVVTGLDGEPTEVHPGAQLDGTRAYGFEDVRNGVLELDRERLTEARYYTDDVSPEATFTLEQKILSGALPAAVEADQAGRRLFVALSGSAAVQELAVGDDGTLEAVPGAEFATAERPIALAIDEEAGELLVATWGGEVLETFALDTRAPLARIDLGHAVPAYPATTLERGERLLYTADWSNNGRKACASCHTDELSTDGLGFSIGTTAPTAQHQIRPLANLLSTSSYRWNGLTGAGLAAHDLRGQTSTNCELVAFGLVEGPGSDPATRVGDPVVAAYSGSDVEACRPGAIDPSTGLPSNFDDIAVQITAEQVTVDDSIRSATGLSRDEVLRAITWYTVSQPRLLPSPVAFRARTGTLPGDKAKKLEAGRAIFQTAGCVVCHDPARAVGPFTDGVDHGPGAGWPGELVERYQRDPRIDLEGVFGDESISDADQTVHLPIDDLIPLCVDQNACVAIADPIEAADAGDTAEESRRLQLIQRFRPVDRSEGFLAGNVIGRTRVNTPSLRGAWSTPTYLHTARARSLGEAILAPGHAALRAGERGLAVASDETIDVHGVTSSLTAQEVDALVFYLTSVE